MNKQSSISAQHKTQLTKRAQHTGLALKWIGFLSPQEKPIDKGKYKKSLEGHSSHWILIPIGPPALEVPPRWCLQKGRQTEKLRADKSGISPQCVAHPVS